MSALGGTGFITTLAVLLAWAGTSKARTPEPTRRAIEALGLPGAGPLALVLTVVELGAAVLALTAPALVSGIALAGLFACFAVGALLLGRDGQTVGCGCFGEGRRAGRVHVAIDAAAVAGAVVVAVQSPSSLARLAQEKPASALAVMASACVAAAVLRYAMTVRAAPTSDRLIEASAMFLEQRISRRSALARIAVVGSALSVAPLRYLLYPNAALAVIAPSSCGSGDCTDGYTAFCCEINSGLNACPSGTFPGGWWKCTDYSGRQLCAAEGVRYYVDCNALPDHPYPGGCTCANNSCENRRVNCNVFRYGQCNTHVAGVTAVVCRMVVCQNPGSIPELNCSSSLAIDDAVCAHESECLTPAFELAGAGGV